MNRYFAICHGAINGDIVAYARPMESATGTGLFLYPESDGISCFDNPIVGPNPSDVAESLPYGLRKAFERNPRFWISERNGTPDAYFDTVSALHLPSVELTNRNGKRLIRLHAKPVIIPDWIASERIAFDPINYSGHKFTDFYVSKDSAFGPGWFIFGRNAEKYGTLPNGKGAYVARVAYPCGLRRWHKHYNGPVMHGFYRMHQAQRICDMLNAMDNGSN